jgi:hypothetical protein
MKEPKAGVVHRGVVYNPYSTRDTVGTCPNIYEWCGRIR